MIIHLFLTDDVKGDEGEKNSRRSGDYKALRPPKKQYKQNKLYDTNLKKYQTSIYDTNLKNIQKISQANGRYLK